MDMWCILLIIQPPVSNPCEEQTILKCGELATYIYFMYFDKKKVLEKIFFGDFASVFL